MKNIKNMRGFSIVELSISLVIIGIVVLATMSSMQAVGDNLGASKTEMRLEKGVNIITENLVPHKNGDIKVQDESMDMRLPDKNDAKSLLYQPDGYGNTFDYIPSADLIDGDDTSPICSATTSNLKMTVKDKDSSVTINNLAFIIISRGANLQKDYTESPNEIKLDKTIKKNVDDVYRYVSLDELKYKLGCSTTARDRFKIITEDLPPLNKNNININMIMVNNLNLKDISWCIQASSTDEASKINDNLILRINNTAGDIHITPNNLPNASNIHVGTGCTDTAQYNQGKELRIIYKQGGNVLPGTYKFTVNVTAKGGESDSKTYVQTVF